MTPARLALLGLAMAGAAAAAPAPSSAPPPKLAFPLACKIGVDCEVQNYFDDDPGPGVRDYHCGRRTYQGHNGVDIRIPDMAAQRRGVAVLAAAPGRVSRLRDGVPDISIRAANAPSITGRQCGNGVVIEHGGGWETQYCHLARGSLKVKVGDQVKAGQPIALVGLSGDTEFPHLHITLRHGTTNLDPFAPGANPASACGARGALWTPAAAAALSYRTGAVLNAGLSSTAVTMASIEAGGVPAPTAGAPLLVAYVRAIGLEKGDVIALSLKNPAGAVLAQTRTAPLDHDKAQIYQMVGKRRPGGGWPHGVYTAEYRVERNGRSVLQGAAKAGL